MSSGDEAIVATVRQLAKSIGLDNVAIAAARGAGRREQVVQQTGAGRSDRSWSLTHCDDLTTAVSDINLRPLGLDIERADRRFLDPDVVCAESESRDQDLFRLLSAKEAAGKAISYAHGITLDPRQLSIRWNDDRFTAVSPFGTTSWEAQITGAVTSVDEFVISLAGPATTRGL